MLKHLPNIGFIEQKLSNTAINKLKEFVNDKNINPKTNLAGNINSSFPLVDKDDWFFKNVLIDTIEEYLKTSDVLVPNVLTQNCGYVLNEFWVNFQKKYEFNPSHYHSGIFSFVIWIKIPSSYEKEKNLDFVKKSNSPRANCFQFSYLNTLGKFCTYTYELSSKWENTMLLFPSSLIHSVYPFYLSDEERISISGNISLDPLKIKS
tara:strand:+ start:876 stop:1493 length:618 start_codon:yes stop_codon:yes gene_type:complete